MRTDEKGNLITLEQDIQRIWKLHGLIVIEEKIKDNTWIIKAENPQKTGGGG